VAVDDDELGNGVEHVVGHEVPGHYGQGVDNGRAEEEDICQYFPYLVEVAEVNEQGGKEETDAVDKEQVGDVDQGEEDYGQGKVLEQDEQYGEEDEKFQEGADEVSQDIA